MAYGKVRTRGFTGHSRTGLLSAIALVVNLGTLGCGGDDVAPEGTPGSDPPDTTVGDPDLTENGSIRVDEAGVIGTASDRKLSLSLPVTEVGGLQAKGSLTIALVSVDGANEIEGTTITYDLEPNGEKKLDAELELPEGIEAQSDLAVYKVKIEQEAQASQEGIRITRSLMYVLTPYELRLEGPARIKRGKPATYRVQTRDAISRAPLTDYPVTLEVANGDQTLEDLEDTSDEMGTALFELNLETPGDYVVAAGTARDTTSAQVERQLQVEEAGAKVLLTTDKPIYQPGQNIHLRTLTLLPPDNAPVTDTPVLLEIEDGKGNKILKRTVDSDDYGIAATTFRLGSVLNMGTFKVRATVDGRSTERSIDVSRYVLPKFKVGITPDKSWYAPGETLTATISAGYFFGKPVANADVLVEAATLDIGETVFRQVQGKTDDSGEFTVSVELPSSLAGLPLEQGNALVNLRVTTTDTAGQQVVQEQLVTLAQNAVDLAIVPEAGQLVPGVDNTLLVFTSDPRGAPLRDTEVVLSGEGQEATVTTDEFGQAEVTWHPSSNGAIEATATPSDGTPITQTFSFTVQTGEEHVIVRTDRALYQTGDSVDVEIVTSGESPFVYVDWLNDGQVVDMRTLQAEDGVAHFVTPLDATLLGSNRVEAYIVDADGSVVRAGKSFFARNASALKVELATDKEQYAPGESAKLTFSVADDEDKPSVAALGVQVVDEAIYSLIDSKPGLLKTHFELEDAYAEPTYEIHTPHADLTELLFADTSADDDEAKAAEQRTSALLAATSATSVMGIQAASWPEVVTQARKELDPFVSKESARLAEALAPLIEAEANDLHAAGCTAADYYCGDLGMTYQEALYQAVSGSIDVYDFWGNAYTTRAATGSTQLMQLVTRGPDERQATDDDIALGIAWADLGLPPMLDPSPEGGGFVNAAASGTTGGTDGGFAGGSGGSGGSGGGGPSGGGEEPRVRRDFPETLYVNPALITDRDGTATLEVPLADSITEWRVTAMANSASGKLGSFLGGMKVFQDFFVDIDFPATLTRGDEVDFPVAVYNYLDSEQTVSLELEAEDWYTPLGSTTVSVTLAPSQVTGVRIPVRVEKVGVGTLTVTAQGNNRSDAVARSVRVIPDGKAMPVTRSGSLAPGEVTLPVTFPEGAVAGSEALHLNVYPAFLAQAVEGMDSMLQVPSGCFEQTTSTTWPNVLVTDYMQATGQITPEIQMKAESLISAGYQRLLTFEHPGGGFSWFGTQDSAPYLSVTAFGLMEFIDMGKVHAIDEMMVVRTRDWLMSEQRSDGSWEGGQTEFFSFNTSTLRNTAFVVWALAIAGADASVTNLGIEYVKNNLDLEAEDAYTLGLVANALAQTSSSDPLLGDILERLDATKHTEDDKSSWDTGGTQTDFYGYGTDGAMATTALVTHALLLAGGYGDTVEQALEYLTSNKDSLGNYGSTQATIWTLRTLLLAASKGTAGAVGSLEVAVDGEAFTTVDLKESQSDVMTTVDLATLATTGDHEVQLTFVGTGQVSYSLVASHHVPWQDVIEEPGPLGVTVSYDKTSLYVNDTATATVSVSSLGDQTTNMVLVTVGIPPGFEVVSEDLDAYLATGLLSRYETTGKQLNLYLSQLAAEAVQEISYRVRATMPVKAADGGAVVYPYYQPDQKSTAASTTLEVLEQ